MLPNLIAPILVYSTLLIPTNILFRGGAVLPRRWYPPAHPELGRDVVRRRRLLHAAALHVLARHGDLLTVLAFNLFGDGLRDALDPRANR